MKGLENRTTSEVNTEEFVRGKTTNHTPGPWHVGAQQFGSAINDADGKCVATASNRFLPGQEMAKDETLRDFVVRAIDNPTISANARLIAAAPDLLATLEGIANVDRYADSNTESLRVVLRQCAEIARAALAKAKP